MMRSSSTQAHSAVAVLMAASSVVVSLLFLILLGWLTYQAGEWLRHCAYDCGDMGGRGLGFLFGVVSLLVPLAGFLGWAGRSVIPDQRWSRVYWSAVEAGVGAVGVLWLLATLYVPIFAIVAVPVSVASLAIAGAIRRSMRAETKFRDALGGGQLADVARRYLPYAVSAAAVGVLLWVGTRLVGTGGACHSYDILYWTACQQDGSAIGASTWIVLLTITGALCVNLAYRLRDPWPHPGWVLTAPIGLLLVGATVTSHFVA